jgi:hypothetical protein
LTGLRRALLLLPALAACYAYAPPQWAAASPDARRPAAPGSGGDRGERRGRIVEKGLRFLGHPFNGDCSGYVRQVMREAGIDLGPLPSARSMSESLHLASQPVRDPAPGDLVFFHDTYDRNRDGELGDLWTHVALVEAVDGDQVSILHRGGKGIIRLEMNLSRPHDETANDPVRSRNGRDPPGTRYLTGELFAGYGAVVE